MEREDGLHFTIIRGGQEVRGGFIPGSFRDSVYDALERVMDEHGISSWDCPVLSFVDAIVELFGEAA